MSDFLFSITVTKSQMSLLFYSCGVLVTFLCLYFFYIMKGVKKHLDDLINNYKSEYERMLIDNATAREDREKINDEMVSELKKLKQVVIAFQRGKQHDDN